MEEIGEASEMKKEEKLYKSLLCRIKLPMLDGNNGWIFQVHLYFVVRQLELSEKLAAIALWTIMEA